MALTKVGLSLGGTNAALTDPNADRILFWDDSASAFTFLTAGSGLDLTGTTLTVADNSITGAKIALGSDAAGDIMYHNGTDYIRLPKGTADQVLTMNDGATAPGWETAAGGGASIASGTYSGNGNATQAITGLSFSPVLVMISKRCNAASCNEVMAIAWKDAIENAGGSGTDRSGTWWAGYNTSNAPHWADDGVRSVDSNGFTVGDASENYLTLNGSGNTYTYVAIG